MAAQASKNCVLDVFRAIYSFQFRIRMHGWNKFKITYNDAWAKENILYAAHHATILIFFFFFFYSLNIHYV